MRRSGIVGIRRRQSDVNSSGPHGVIDQHQTLIHAIGRHLNAVGNLQVCRGKAHARTLVTAANNTAAHHIRAAEQLSSQLHMALSQLMTNAGGANGLTALAKQVVPIYVNATLGTPGAHLGNTRSTASTEAKIAAHANRSNIENARQQRKKTNMVECRDLRRKGNGHHCVDPGLS